MSIAPGRKALWRGLTASSAALLAICILLVVHWRADIADRDFRQALATQAQALADTFDPKIAAAFRSDNRALRNEAILRLDRQLSAYQAALPHAAISSLQLNEAGLAPYLDASPKLRHALEELVVAGGARSYGPYRSLDGEVVSAFAPLRADGGAALPLLVKISVDAAEWRAARLEATLFSLSMVIPLVAIMLSGMWALWYRQRQRRTRRPGPMLRNLEAIVVAAFGVAATLTVATIFYSNEKRAQAERFGYVAHMQGQRLNASLQRLVGGNLGMIARFHEASDTVTQEEFAAFLEPVMQRDPLVFLGWAPAVRAEERRAFEDAIREEAASPEHEKIALRDTRLLATGDAHFPLLFLVGGDERFGIGTDLAAHGATLHPWAAHFAASLPIVGGEGDGPPVLIGIRALAEPAGAPSDQPSAHRLGPGGMLAVGVDVEELFRRAGAQAEQGGVRLALDLFALSRSNRPILVASVGLQGDADFARWGGCAGPSSACAVLPLFVAGGAYALLLRAEDGFVARSFFHAAAPALAFGLLLTLLTVALSLFVIRRREASEHAIRMRNVALKESEGRFRTLLSSMNDLVIVFDESGVCREIIQPKTGGYALSDFDLVGKRIHETSLPQETKDLLDAALVAVLLTGMPRMVDYSLDLASGRHWFSASISALRNGRGEVNGLIAVARDITQRKLAETSLQQREAFLRQLMALSAQFVDVRAENWDATVDSALAQIGSFCEADRSYLFVFEGGGATMSNTHEWVGEGVTPQRDNLQSIDAESMPNIARALRCHETLAIDCIEELPPSWRAEREALAAQDISALIIVPVLDGGDLIGFVGFDAIGRRRDWSDEARLLRVFADILASAMARRRADAALRESEARYREVVNKVREVIFEADRNGRWVFLNKAFEEITGFPVKEALGRSVVSFIQNDDRPEALAQIAAMLAGEVLTLRHTARCITSAGETRWVELACRVNRDAEGEICGTYGTLIDVTERRAAQEEIERLAFYDSLTQLPNRRLFMERLAGAVARSGAREDHAALLFVDLDNFKTLNDTYGHESGDLLLRQVARRLTASVHEIDVVGRLGGDEFVVILRDLSREREEAERQARLVAERIRKALKEPYDLDGHDHHVTPSIGVTLFSGEERSIDALLRHADLAMYKAKASGRNSIRLFTADMEEVVLMRAGLEADLRNAIDRRELALHLQAQVDQSGGVTGAEALLRWRHPARGVVSPADFIPVAEETGLIVPIGQWVVEEACAALARLQKRSGRSDLTMSVNVSARQFRHPTFVEDLIEAIARHDFAPDTLKLELTESLFLEDVDFVVEKMNQLRARGLRFSLDDFGTGYSSLTYLKRLPFDEIKIDQSFVADIAERAQAATIARTIIDMGHALGLRVIAEGVETPSQLSRLLAAGCLAYQGYLFGRPQPVDAFLDTLLEGEQRQRLPAAG